MKKLIISVAVAVAVVFGVFQINNNNNNLSELQMENVELLAQGESGCPYGCKDWTGGCDCNGHRNDLLNANLCPR
ncbi:MAG: NVEALA domain-containing protein [Bacteroidales bacterium]|nr:NVEALA domain-containing protein [Bacteroidales bacterium]